MQNEDIAAIYEVAELLDIDESVAEKDFYVTQVINIVSAVTHDFYDLVFQGGTSLAKVHRIVFETAAEKWVGLTRLVALSAYRKHSLL